MNPILLTSVFSFVLILLCAFPISTQEPSKPPAGGGVVLSAPEYRVVRSLSGSKQQQQSGRMVIEDPRTVFYIPEDKQVIVYFEWEGPTGPHTFEALWKNPEGKVAVISEFKFDAKEKRFGGYWTLITSEAMPTGLWTLDARIDGVAAGTHPFQILAAARPADAIPARRTLTHPEVYQRALASTVSILRLASDGERLGLSTGFFLAEGLVATTFHGIDGASSVRILLPDGSQQDVAGVMAWNRRQDWAILKVAWTKAQILGRSKSATPTVGDRCFTLDAGTGVNRVLSETELIGHFTAPGAGLRLNVATYFESTTSGAPLLNEYGELIGIVGVSILPGASSLNVQRFGIPTGLTLPGGNARGSLVLPVELLPAIGPDAKLTTLAELMQSGQFIRPLTAARHVLYGNIGRQVGGRKDLPEIVDIRSDFKKGEQEMGLIVMWDPKDKLKTTVTLRIYDVENRMIGEGKPSKMNLQPKSRSYSTWKFSIASLSPGYYRLDVSLGEEPAWRTFFRITD